MSDVDEWWDQLDDDLASVPAELELRHTPYLSSADYTAYHARFSSAGHQRVTGYLSIPNRPGPTSALLELPGRYGSVVHVPHHNDRQRHVVLTLMHRGQRQSDVPFRASFPGLFTLGIDDPATYVYRGILADCIRAAEIIAGVDGVDPERIGAVGDDMALLTTARRPGLFRAVRVDTLRFTRAWERRSATDTYPLEELNELMLHSPERETGARATLAMLDPIAAAHGVTTETLVTVPTGVDTEPYTALLAALGAAGTRFDTTHVEYEHDDLRDAWISERLGVQPMARYYERAGIRAESSRGTARG